MNLGYCQKTDLLRPVDMHTMAANYCKQVGINRNILIDKERVI